MEKQILTELLMHNEWIEVSRIMNVTALQLGYDHVLDK
jgi:hypothetical protein